MLRHDYFLNHTLPYVTLIGAGRARRQDRHHSGEG
jgi:hypothetical protein